MPEHIQKLLEDHSSIFDDAPLYVETDYADSSLRETELNEALFCFDAAA